MFGLNLRSCLVLNCLGLRLPETWSDPRSLVFPSSEPTVQPGKIVESETAIGLFGLAKGSVFFGWLIVFVELIRYEGLRSSFGVFVSFQNQSYGVPVISVLSIFFGFEGF